MTAKSYLFSTMKKDEDEDRQHGGSGGKFDDNRNFLQKWADSFFKKNGITAEDRAKVTLRNSPFVKAKELFNVVSDKVADVKGTTTSQTGTSAKPIVYSDWSPAAQQFGMDQSTAYAEHMANTAHQREVEDLRAAGLNPVLGISGSGSGSVSGSAAMSGSSSAEKNFNLNGLFDFLGATAGLIASVKTKNPATGYMITKAGDKLGDLFK